MVEYLRSCLNCFRQCFKKNIKLFSYQPYVVFDYTRRNGSNVAAGEQFSTKILLKTAPKTVADWIIKADVSHDTDLSLCTISVKEYGYDISYVNLSTKARKVARADPTKYSSGWLELYKLSNIGEII